MNFLSKYTYTGVQRSSALSLRDCQGDLDSKCGINMLFRGLEVFRYQAAVLGHAVDALLLYATFSPFWVWVEHSGQHHTMLPSLPCKHLKTRIQHRLYWCCCCWYPHFALKGDVLAIVTERLSYIYAKPNFLQTKGRSCRELQGKPAGYTALIKQRCQEELQMYTLDLTPLCSDYQSSVWKQRLLQCCHWRAWWSVRPELQHSSSFLTVTCRFLPERDCSTSLATPRDFENISHHWNMGRSQVGKRWHSDDTLLPPLTKLRGRGV